MEHKKDILWRTYLVYILMVVFSIAIVWRIVTVQFVEGDMWREKANRLTTMYVDIEAARGNIFDLFSVCCVSFSGYLLLTPSRRSEKR